MSKKKLEKILNVIGALAIYIGILALFAYFFINLPDHVTSNFWRP